MPHRRPNHPGLAAPAWPAAALLLAGWLTVLAAHGQTAAVAEVVAVRGSVQLRARDVGWRPVSAGQVLQAGDTLRTGADGWVAVLAADETRFHLNRNSLFVFAEVAASAGWLRRVSAVVGRSLYRLFGGEVLVENDNRGNGVVVETPTLKAGIRGTAFVLRVPAPRLSVLTVLDGAVSAATEQDRLTVNAGQRVTARAGQPLRLERLRVAPREAVQWALWVPPLPEPARPDDLLREARGDLLSGRPGAARTTLTRLTQANPRRPLPWQLLAIARLTLGDRPGALAAAERAVAAAPGSPAALLTLSAVHQARFDLPRATATARRALALRPDHVPALVSLARLQFGSDDPDGAWRNAGHALRLAPDDAEVQNLIGFLRLARRDSAGAGAALRRAAELNPRLSEPHLGLALDAMRQGRPQVAFKHLATAVLLDPLGAMPRSYWAKMLYQLRRFDKALAMIEQAKTLDPQDPTPWLYEGLILRELNRPAQAVRALNRAAALNDRRGVYRSRFLLDRDLAVAGVNQAQAYRELGLDAWARHRARASLEQDYGNHSAHVFLAGALAEDDERAIRQTSEALLGRLLQPGNVNSFNSFNDYTVLLEQPGLNVSAAAGAGSHHGLVGELSADGVLPAQSLAFQAGAVYDADDGWRDSNGQRFSDLAGVVKWNPAPDHGLLFAASRARTELRDELYPRFEADFPADPLDRFENRGTRLELAYHHHFGPRADLLLFGSRLDIDSDQLDRSLTTVDGEPPLSLELFSADRFHNRLWQAQAHYTRGLGRHQWHLGTLYYREDETLAAALSGFALFEDSGERVPLEGRLSFDNRVRRRFHSIYLQDSWSPSAALTLDAALYFDRYNGADVFADSEWTVEKLNPRLGVIWRPGEQDRDTLRVAAFRTLLPFVSTRLDPTDVAGIDVFRNGLEGSLSEELALAWEREWDGGFLSLGVFHRRLRFGKNVLSDDAGTSFRAARGRSRGATLDWNQLLPWPGTALNAGYRYLDVEHDRVYALAADSVLPSVDRVEHVFRLGFTVRSPGGAFAGLRQSYRAIDSRAAGRPDEDIWLTDLQAGYRFAAGAGEAKLELRNVFDRRFNWLSDPFAAGAHPPAPARTLTATLRFNF